jgi:hypothetical protein
MFGVIRSSTTRTTIRAVAAEASMATLTQKIGRHWVNTSMP